MTILLAEEGAARIGGRIEGEEGRAAACQGCPLRAHCLRRPAGALAVVTAVRDAPWKPCRLRGRVRAVEAQVYPVEAPRRAAPVRRLRVVLDTCALDHPDVRAAIGLVDHDFIIPEEVLREAQRAPWRHEVAWEALRVVAAPVRHPHIREARPSCKVEPPSAADRAVMQAAWDVDADVLVSADRHVTEAGLEGQARAAGRGLRVERPESFVRRCLSRRATAAA